MKKIAEIDKIIEDGQSTRGKIVNFSLEPVEIEGLNVIDPFSSHKATVLRTILNEDVFSRKISSDYSSFKERKAERVFSAILNIGRYFNGIVFEYSQVATISKELIAMGVLNKIEVIFVSSKKGKIERPMKEIVDWLNQSKFGA